MGPAPGFLEAASLDHVENDRETDGNDENYGENPVPAVVVVGVENGEKNEDCGRTSCVVKLRSDSTAFERHPEPTSTSSNRPKDRQRRRDLLHF
jgi:hypothetical protein